MASDGDGLPLRRFGEYTIGRCIGTGGMAAVYAARQETSLGMVRMVALKILHSGVAPDPQQREAFRREASLATRLEHTGIVRTYDVGEQGGHLYLVMELLHGAVLSAARPGAAPTAVALRVLDDVARALHYAHELAGPDGRPLGLVHQDVTPHNILVGYDGRARLLDFGVARLGSIDSSRTDHVRGKPAYLAPEQLESGRLDRRVDVFALGIVAHELLTGERLFRRESITATYHAVLVEPIPDVRARNPDVPEGVASAIARALRRDPAARWPTAEAFRSELASAARLHGVPAVDDLEITRWIGEVAPPGPSPGELEREILRGAGAPGGGDDIAERVTAPPEATLAPTAPQPLASDADARRPQVGPPLVSLRGPLSILAAIALVASLAGFGLFAWRGPAPGAAAPAVVAAPPPAAAVASSTPATPATPGASASASPGSPASAAITTPTRKPRTAPRPGAPPAIDPVVSPTPAPAPPPAPSPVPAPAPGYVSVWSSVWGHVDVDGRAVGDSPLSRVPVAPGAHVVHIVTDRGEQNQTVSVGSSGESRVRFVF